MAAETFKVDKSAWGPGPWQAEPDREDFIAFGFACLALRHPEHGHFCGYVGVPREHPYYGKPHGDIAGLEMHGYEVNYAAPCEGLICHTPAPGMPEDVWWIGGDFGHAFDKCPGRDARVREAREAARAKGLEIIARAFEPTPFDLQFRSLIQYRPLPYVRAEIEKLARQLRDAGATRPRQHPYLKYDPIAPPRAGCGCGSDEGE